LEIVSRFRLHVVQRRRGAPAPPPAERGHPYLRGPAMFAKSLRSAILRETDAAELDATLAQAELDYRDPKRFGTT